MIYQSFWSRCKVTFQESLSLRVLTLRMEEKSQINNPITYLKTRKISQAKLQSGRVKEIINMRFKSNAPHENLVLEKTENEWQGPSQYNKEKRDMT